MRDFILFLLCISTLFLALDDARLEIQLRNISKKLDSIETHATVLNIPNLKSKKLEKYAIFNILEIKDHVSGKIVGNVPILTSETEFAEWLDKIRLTVLSAKEANK